MGLKPSTKTIVNIPEESAAVDFKSVDHVPYLETDQWYRIGDIVVQSDGEMHGGGSAFGQNIISVVNTLYPGRIFNNCLEWCSGPGFIGFSLLAHDLIRNLYLGDIFKPALYACEQTIKSLPERYKDRTFETIHMSSSADIPDGLKFDLITANPPHWDWSGSPYITRLFNSRINADNHWQIHQEFFKHIKQHLSDDGIILLQEQTWASGPTTFKKFVEDSGLKISRCFHTSDNLDFWYLEVIHA